MSQTVEKKQLVVSLKERGEMVGDVICVSLFNFAVNVGFLKSKSLKCLKK